jgi:hypothetical protein
MSMICRNTNKNDYMASCEFHATNKTQKKINA